MSVSNIPVLSAVRGRYPATSQLTYLDVAARGVLSIGTREAMDAYLDMRMAQGGDKAWMFAQVEKARETFAALIGAEADEIALTKNVSDGINSFASALPWRAGDNVVLCESVEHPANVFPWYNLHRQKSIVVKTVDPSEGRIPFEAIADTIDAKTRVVAIASVSFSPGFRFAIKALADYCRVRGVLLLVDAAQSVGILDTDVRALGVDAMAVSTQKGLLALYGLGFLYVRRELAETLNPVYLSRSGVRVEVGHEASAGDASQYELAVGARRFDVGNHNYIGAIAVEHSMRELMAVGVKTIERHVCGLAAKLAQGFAEAGLPVFGGPSHPDRAHIVALGYSLSDQHDAVSDEQMLALHEHFTRANIRHTIRRGMLRFSLHYYNNEDDVGRTIAVAREWVTTTTQRVAGSRINSAHLDIQENVK
jgi:cysteine desulfurase / selenocysteine lyase